MGEHESHLLGRIEHIGEGWEYTAADIAAVRRALQRIAELEAERDAAKQECHDRNHAGLDRVITGARLPDGLLGQDAAFIAHVIGSLERDNAALRAEVEKLKQHIVRRAES